MNSGAGRGLLGHHLRCHSKPLRDQSFPCDSTLGFFLGSKLMAVVISTARMLFSGSHLSETSMSLPAAALMTLVSTLGFFLGSKLIIRIASA
jgi:hypothetical protein